MSQWAKVIRCEPKELEEKINAQLNGVEAEVTIIPLPILDDNNAWDSVILLFKA